jgi:hypothetical protein
VTTIPAALDIAEDVVLPALRTLGAAWWGVAPVGTVGRLQMAPGEPRYLRRFWVAQHQDGGGQFAPLLGSAGWQGEVVVRCHAATDRSARDGRDAAHTAMLALTGPAGYALNVKPLPPLALPSPDEAGIYGRATRYRITIRRVPV